MPRVPKSGERVGQSSVPGVRVSTRGNSEAFGFGPSAQRVSNEMQNANSETLKIIQAEKTKADKVRDRDARSKMAEFSNEFLYNKDTGALNRRGESAFSVPDEFNEAYNKKYNEIRDSLASEDQRAAFEETALQYRLDMDRAINIHVSKQTQVYDEDRTEALVTNERQAAINSFDDPKRIALSLARQVKAIKEQGTDSGKPKEWVDAQITDSLSKTHVGVIENLILTDTRKAREYFNANKSQINQDNLNPYDLEQKILAFQTANSKKLRDDLEEKILDGTADPGEIKALGKDVEAGGIGAHEAGVLLKRMKDGQAADVKNAIKGDKDAKKFNKIVDKLIGDDVDNYNMKQELIEAWSSGGIDKEERNNLNRIRKLMEDATFKPSIFSWGFKKSAKQLKDRLEGAGFGDEDVKGALIKLINYNDDGKKDPEDMDNAARAILKEKQIKKNPNNARQPGVPFQNAQKAWVVTFEKEDGSLGVRRARPDELKAMKK